MNKQLIILILCFSSFSYSQIEKLKAEENSFVSIETTCEKGSEKANEDFGKGIFNSFSYGWAADTNPKDHEKFKEFYTEYVRKKYSINIEHKGCVISDYSKCYSNTMNELILDKFGKDVFKKARKEALVLFAHNNN